MDKKISFHLLERSDLPIIMKWRISAPVTKFMYTDPALDLEKQESWFDSILNDQSMQYFMVSCDGLPFGIAHLYDISTTHSRCFLAYYIGEQDYKNKGMAKHITGNIYDYVFFKMSFNKICGDIFSFNQKVLDLAFRRGFEQEGYFKQHIYKKGEFYDVVRVALFREKWEKIRPCFDYQKFDINPRT